MQPAEWNGSASISKGAIEKIAGYHFTRDSRIKGLAWECSTHPWAPFAAGMHPNEKPQPQPTMVETIGVTIDFFAPADALLTVKVPKGEFSFRPMDVPESEGIFPLGATVEIYRTPIVHQVTRSEEHTSELQSPCNLVCRLLLEKKKIFIPVVRGLEFLFIILIVIVIA